MYTLNQEYIYIYIPGYMLYVYLQSRIYIYIYPWIYVICIPSIKSISMMMVQFTLLRVNQDDDYTLHNIVEKTYLLLFLIYSKHILHNMVQNTYL